MAVQGAHQVVPPVETLIADPVERDRRGAERLDLDAVVR